MLNENGDRTSVTNEIENRKWRCSTHGLLDDEELTVSVGGQLLCDLCSIFREGQADESIDPRVEMVTEHDTPETEDDREEIES